jgi:transcriptional regulator with AAA-type ATPase domain
VRGHAEGTLVDFGFIGTAQRFEARAHNQPCDLQACARASALVAAWLQHTSPFSSRVIRLEELPDARVLRQRGFVPCDVALLNGGELREHVCAAVARRSVAILDAGDTPTGIALGLLRLRQLGVREFCAIARRPQKKRAHIMKAAEGRATYGARPLVDPRAAQMFREVERLIMRGRHAAAERTLRAAFGSFDRRGDAPRAGDAALRLGQLLLGRGRAADAKAAFSNAQEQFQRIRSASRAVEASVYLGLAETDLAQLNDAEQTCHAAYSAALALGAPEGVLFPALALARVLLTQKRYAEARAVLEAVSATGDAEQCARYWCIASRLRLAADAVTDAWRAVERARPATSSLSPAIEAVVRDCEAAVQARLGDVEALRIHVTNGLAAARAARLPLRAIRLRLTYVEGLISAERFGQARSAARHLIHTHRGGLPPLLMSRVEAVRRGLEKTPTARESSATFKVTTFANDVRDLEGLRELLAASHHVEDEGDVLTRAATAIRRHTHAAGIGIFGGDSSRPRLLGSCGTAGEQAARRSIDIGQPIAPEASGSWIEGAVPIHYLGRIIGAIAMRWTVDGPASAEHALAFVGAAAAVCAPFVYVMVERHGTPVAHEGDLDLIGTSAAIVEVRKAVTRAANAPFTILLEGESGSGKELVARAIHRAGCRRDRRFSALNCAAMPEDLVDTELFGHAKGAFTGAAAERLGLFESADGGTVFLDEVGELSARAQAKLLRVLQEGEVRRIGENFTRAFDARLVAATNRSLRAEADAGRFRQDLLYRLDVIRINVPPLRERVEDIPLLTARFWRQAAERIGSKAVLGHGVVCALARYDWPGNVRELQNVLTALVVAVPQRGLVRASDLPAAIARAAEISAHESLESARLKFEERFVRAALARSAGHRGQTAAALGLSRQGLAKLMQRLKLDA